MTDELKKQMEELVDKYELKYNHNCSAYECCNDMNETEKHFTAGFQSCHDLMQSRIDVLLSKQSQYESTMLATIAERDRAVAALNKIAILGSGALAYTSDFTEEVMSIAREALGVKERRF